MYSEVGSKNPNEVIPPYKWVRTIQQELEAGSEKLSAKLEKAVRLECFAQMVKFARVYSRKFTDQIPAKHLLFEAPKKEQQVWFIRKYGSNVNLGNIQPEEVIPLETFD